jgi:hypothetical protein
MKNANFTTILWCGLIYAVLLVIVILVVLPWSANADQLIKIAILDTGYDAEYAKQIGAEPLKLCPTGHYNFDTSKAEVGFLNQRLFEGRGKHGTVVASIIAENLKRVNYCAIIYQIYKTPTILNSAIANAITALKMMEKEGVTAVNMSYGGYEPHSEEFAVMNHLSNKGTMFFVAAGNDHKDLSKQCRYFPACYDILNKVTVGAKNYAGLCSVSNYGKIVTYALGLPPAYLKLKEKVCATSYAVPNALSDYVLSVSRLYHGDYRLVPQKKQ